MCVPEGASVGLVVRGGGADSDDFEGACLVERAFIFEDSVIGAFVQSLTDCGDCVVYSYPATGFVFGAAKKLWSLGLWLRLSGLWVLLVLDCVC